MRTKTTVYIVSTDTPSSLMYGNVSRNPGLYVEPVKIAFAEADGILTTTPPVLGATIVSENKSKS